MWRSLRERVARWICPELGYEADFANEPEIDGYLHPDEAKRWIDFAVGSTHVR